ncbi:MAG: hypothetical protein IJO43_05225 [Bacilli bacterium]|nr:hypothetical protein [Bacilli bacterium]
MKNRGFDNVFGNHDKGFKALIEEQAGTESRHQIREDSKKVKRLTKGTRFNTKSIRRRSY